MKDDRKKILIDTDIGDDIDDAAALIMAFNSPEFKVLGITTVFQNSTARADMVIDLCEKCNVKEIPVHAGMSSPIIERPDTNKMPIQYSIINPSNKQSWATDGVDFIIQTAKENPDLTIVEMGAMTNLGLAFYLEPEIMKNVKIIAMGGIFRRGGVEWNIKCDPEATKIVMDYAKHLIMVGLDVTKYCGLSEERLDELCPENNKKMQYYKKGAKIFNKKTGYPYTLHDALLVAYLIDNSVLKLTKSDFSIELSGENTRGAIVFKTNPYDIIEKSEKDFYYAEHADIPRFWEIVKERFF